jgi:prevent-host-death family protein
MYMSMYILSMSGSKQYSIAQARSSLPTIVDEAQAGVDVELTRRGKPVAAVISLEKLLQS